MNVLLRPWRHYADFSGRSRRTEFWLFKICFWVIICAIIVLGGGISQANSAGASVPVLFVGIFVLAAIVPNWAVTVRRLHDQGKSGGLILLTFLPYLGLVASLIFGCIPGDKEENEYGFNPRDPNAADDTELENVFS